MVLTSVKSVLPQTPFPHQPHLTQALSVLLSNGSSIWLPLHTPVAPCAQPKSPFSCAQTTAAASSLDSPLLSCPQSLSPHAARETLRTPVSGHGPPLPTPFLPETPSQSRSKTEFPAWLTKSHRLPCPRRSRHGGSLLLLGSTHHAPSSEPLQCLLPLLERLFPPSCSAHSFV